MYLRLGVTILACSSVQASNQLQPYQRGDYIPLLVTSAQALNPQMFYLDLRKSLKNPADFTSNLRTPFIEYYFHQKY